MGLSGLFDPIRSAFTGRAERFLSGVVAVPGPCSSAPKICSLKTSPTGAAGFQSQLRVGGPSRATGKANYQSLQKIRDRQMVGINEELEAEAARAALSTNPNGKETITLVSSHSPAAAAYLRSKRSSGLPAGL